jgi:capsular polysaccharide biosynthesis protein
LAIRALDARVGALTSSLQDWYFHWMFDVLPRLAMLDDEAPPPDLLYLRRALPFQRQTLDLIGVDPGTCIDCAVEPVISARTLVVPSHQITHGRAFPPWVIERLRGWFLPGAARPTVVGSRRVYLSRSGTTHRRVVNEDEVVEVLEQAGIERVAVQDLAVAEQVALFRDAELVIAPHGGALTNLVFCSEGARVIELFPPQPIDLYQRLSHAVGLDYTYVRASGTRQGLGREDYEVPLDDLRRSLALIGVG